MRHLESHLQIACVRWFKLQYPTLAQILCAVPNGGSRNKLEAVRLKMEGVTAGCSDLLLLTPRNDYGCLCIELKTEEKSSRQSESQKQWQKATEQAGNKYVICRSLDEFIIAINQYLTT